MTKSVCEHSGIEFESKNGWISVKDRLPEEDEIVLAYIPRFPGHVIAIMRNKYLSNRFLDYHPNDNKISHWMPLPPAPEGE